MKKRVLPLFLCLAMIFSLAVPALAADQTTASTTITKTVTDPPANSGGGGGGGDDDEPVNFSSYEISIPASFSLDDGDFFEIGATKLEIGEQQDLYVSVDYERTFDADGYFYLRNTNNVAQKLPCTISRGYASGVYWETITSAENSPAAIFNLASGTTPNMYGAIKITTAGSPSTAGGSSVAGTYSGTIYFTIQVIDY
jgi:hypothetical protein